MSCYNPLPIDGFLSLLNASNKETGDFYSQDYLMILTSLVFVKYIVSALWSHELWVHYIATALSTIQTQPEHNMILQTLNITQVYFTRSLTTALTFMFLWNNSGPLNNCIHPYGLTT